MTEYVPSEKQLTLDEMALKDVRASYEEAYGFHDDDVQYSFKSRKGLDEAMVRQISAMKGEPQWMTDLRVEAYHIFLQNLHPIGAVI